MLFFASFLAAEGLDHRSGALDPDRRYEDREIDAGGAERRELFSAATDRAEQAHRIQEPVG